MFLLSLSIVVAIVIVVVVALVVVVIVVALVVALVVVIVVAFVEVAFVEAKEKHFQFTPKFNVPNDKRKTFSTSQITKVMHL